MTWGNTQMFLTDSVEWILGPAATARTWVTQSEASQVLWAFRKARAWRRELHGAQVEPVPTPEPLPARGES